MRGDRQIDVVHVRDVLIRPEQMPEIAFKGSPSGTLTRTAASILDGWYVDRRSSEKEAIGKARCIETEDMSAAVAGAVGNASSAYSVWGLGALSRPVAYLRGCVAFRRMAAMASTSSSCPAATLMTRS